MTIFNGSAGNDVLPPAGADSSGIDDLYGLAGDDTLQGGAGADHLYGGDGSDTVSYADSARLVYVDLAYGLGGGLEDDYQDTFSGIENALGSAFNDELFGDAAANTLSGGGGADMLKGFGGADWLIGGAGFDTADYAASASGITVNLRSGRGSGGDAAGDVLSGIEHLFGSAYDDTLIGNGGANTIVGNEGDDVLGGRGGADEVHGSAGADRFMYGSTAFSNLTSGYDRVADFSDAEGDRFDLGQIDANTLLDGDQAFIFASDATLPSAGVVTYDPAGWVYAANDDVAGWDLVIRTDPNLNLTASQFIL